MLLLLAGCGSGGGGGGYPVGGNYNFVGMWSGTLAFSETTCSDNSKIPGESNQITITIGKSGTDLTWTPKCGEVRLSQSQNTATQVHDVTCPPAMNNGVLLTQTIHDTTFVVNVNAMTVDTLADYVIGANGMTGTCKGRHGTGTFIRH